MLVLRKVDQTPSWKSSQISPECNTVTYNIHLLWWLNGCSWSKSTLKDDISKKREKTDSYVSRYAWISEVMCKLAFIESYPILSCCCCCWFSCSTEFKRRARGDQQRVHDLLGNSLLNWLCSCIDTPVPNGVLFIMHSHPSTNIFHKM